MSHDESAEARYECSILLPLRNGVALTRACFEALARVTAGVRHEVILVDDGTTDETQALLAQLSGDVTIVRNDKPTSYARAYNQAAALAKSPRLVLLRHNTTPTPRWLDALLRTAQHVEKLGVVGSKLISHKGGVHHAGVVFSRENRLPYHVYERLASDAPEVNRARELQVVTAAGSLIPREVWDLVGGFDEGFKDGYEDVDFCLRVRAAGYKVCYEPRSTLIHRDTPHLTTVGERLANRDRLLSRWKGQPLGDEDIVLASDGYARLYSSVGGEARTTLRRFTDDEESERFGRLALAEQYAVDGDRAGTLAVVREQERWPTDPGALKWAGVLAAWAGDPDLAERYWEQALASDDAPELHAALARQCLLRGELDKAGAHLDALLARSTADADGWFLRGVHALAIDDYPTAQSAFESALLNGADPRRSLLGQGIASFHCGDPDLAFDLFSAVVAEHPTDGEALNWLIRASVAPGRLEDLREALAARVAQNTEDLSGRFALAATHVRLGEVKAARSQYDAIRRRNPRFDGLADLEAALGSAAPIRGCGAAPNSGAGARK